MSESTIQPVYVPPAIRIAAVGAGEVLQLFSRLVCRPDFPETFPWIRFVAFSNLPAATLQEISFAGEYSVFSEYTAMFSAFPEINIVFDLSDDSQYSSALRLHAPEYCSVCQKAAVESFCAMLSSEQQSHTCMRDLRRAQTLFSTLIDQVDEDILLLDTKGRIIDANRTVLTRKNMSKKDIVGNLCDELEEGVFCCPDKKDDGGPLEETLRTGEKAERLHTRVTEEGRMQYFRTYTYPVFGRKGRIHRVIEVRRDITSRTHMEQRLQQSEKMAAIGELSTYVAHEIRNPLFAIGGFANSLLRSSSLDEAARGKVEIILKESKRLDEILKTTLNFARPTDSEKGEIDLNCITQETVQLMCIGCEKKGITTRMFLEPSIAKGRGDAEQFKQCLINVVKNAMEAMEGGGELSVKTAMNQTHAFVTVDDTGHGIPESLREKIFSPFFSTKDKGAGLGLAMTKKIIEEMGGYVELVTQKGVGTTITLALLPQLDVDLPDFLDPPSSEDFYV